MNITATNLADAIPAEARDALLSALLAERLAAQGAPETRQMLHDAQNQANRLVLELDDAKRRINRIVADKIAATSENEKFRKLMFPVSRLAGELEGIADGGDTFLAVLDEDRVVACTKSDPDRFPADGIRILDAGIGSRHEESAKFRHADRPRNASAATSCARAAISTVGNVPSQILDFLLGSRTSHTHLPEFRRRTPR